jgi:hypothetical protein
LASIHVSSGIIPDLGVTSSVGEECAGAVQVLQAWIWYPRGVLHPAPTMSCARAHLLFLILGTGDTGLRNSMWWGPSPHHSMDTEQHPCFGPQDARSTPLPILMIKHCLQTLPDVPWGKQTHTY